MNMINRASKALGIELQGRKGKAAFVSQQGQQIINLQLFELELKEDKSSHLYLDAAEESTEIQKLLANELPISVLAAKETLVRSLEVKLKKEKEIDSVLSFQAEPQIPYPIEEAILDKLLLHPTTEGTQLTLLAVKQSHLENHLKHLKQLDIEPEIVTTTPLALTAFSAYLLPEKPPHFVLYIGEEQICCTFSREGKLVASQSSDMTLADLHDKSAHASGSTGSEMERVKQEIERLLFSLMKQVKELHMPHILLCGKGCEDSDLKEQLLQTGQKMWLTPPVPQNCELPLSKLQAYAIPIGAALTALPKHACPVNFRQKEFAYPYPWKKWTTPFYLYFGCCMAATLALMLFKSSYIGSKEDEIRQSYATLLHQANITHAAFEKSLNPTQPATEYSATQANLKLLTAEDIQYRLNALEKELQSTPDVFPLHPNIPRVSDVLAWLASHPKAIKTETTGEVIPLIQLESFHYAILKRPENTKKQEKYQAKVEFEFTSRSPTIAREFHEALLAPNDFVDPKMEPKWSSEKGKYKAIFFLKDKTSYL